MSEEQMAPVLSAKDWVITILIVAIPLVGLVFLFIWAFSDTENPNRSNWAKAQLIMMLIGIGITTILFFAVMLPIINEYAPLFN